MAHVERACVFVGWPGFWEHCSSCAHLASIKAVATLRNATEPRINRSPVDGTVRTDAHAKTTRWTAVLVRPRAHQTFTYLITARCVVSPYQKNKTKQKPQKSWNPIRTGLKEKHFWEKCKPLSFAVKSILLLEAVLM